jgi:DNA oxidative demethylase
MVYLLASGLLHMMPSGFVYVPEFISPDEEEGLLEKIQQLTFSDIKMHGVTARRRATHFGWTYDFLTYRVKPGPLIPEFLLGIRERLADLVEKEPESLVQALILEYPPGATIGWHRDAPAFGIVAALSLLAPCRLRLRRASDPGWKVNTVIEPRSAYALTGPARNQWQHSIPALKSLRYSITFRTLRGFES